MVAEASRFNVAACGRQMGKTTLGINRVASAVQQGHTAAWMAPTYKYLDEVWRQLLVVLEPITEDRSVQQHRIATKGGGSVECWSLDDPDAARGRKYHRIIVDEAALVRDLDRVWQASLRPTLSVLNGDAWFLSTPKGMDSFHQLYQLGQDEYETDWQSWQMPSSASPYITPTEIEAARRDLPQRIFEQEYLAEFLPEGSGVFRGVMAACTLEPATGPEPGHRYVMGVDWGKVDDFTAISVIDATARQQVALDRFNQIDYAFQTARLDLLVQLWKPLAIIAESNAMGQPLIEELDRRYSGRVYGFTTTHASKAEAIESLSLAIERQDLALLTDKTQRSELLAYTTERTPSGLLRYTAPSGGHDDTVMALALAWSAADTPSGPSVRSSYSLATPTPAPRRVLQVASQVPLRAAVCSNCLAPLGEHARYRCPTGGTTYHGPMPDKVS